MVEDEVAKTPITRQGTRFTQPLLMAASLGKTRAATLCGAGLQDLQNAQRESPI